jgi:THO complex subunit 2
MSYPSPFQYISEKDAKDIEEVKRKLAELGAESERLMDTNVISSKGQTLMSELIWHIATGNISPTTLAPILIHTEIFQSIETNNDDDGAGFNRTRKVASWFLDTLWAIYNELDITRTTILDLVEEDEDVDPGAELDTAEEQLEKLSLFTRCICVLENGKRTIFHDLALEQLSLTLLHNANLIPGAPKDTRLKLVKKRTARHFIQQKYNLLGEETEGFSKVITELNQVASITTMAAVATATAAGDAAAASSYNHASAVSHRIKSLIGYFNLDPNRTCDLVFEALENCLGRQENMLTSKGYGVSTLANVLKIFRKSTICHILGRRFHVNVENKDSAKDKNNNESTSGSNKKKRGETKKKDNSSMEHSPPRRMSLCRVAALLIASGQLDTNDILPHLQPHESALRKNRQESTTHLLNKAAGIGKVKLGASKEEREAEEREKIEKERKLNEEFKMFSNANQKYGILCGLYDLYAWEISKVYVKNMEAVGGKPLADMNVIQHLCNMGKNILQPAYETIPRKINPTSLKLAKHTDSTINSSYNTENVSMYNMYTQCTSTKTIASRIGPIVLRLGEQVGKDIVFYTRVCRALAYSIKVENSLEDATQRKWLMALLEKCLVPAISMLEGNIGAVSEIWTVLALIPYNLRYKFYAQWKTFAYIKKDDLVHASAEAKNFTKLVMRRLAKENVITQGMKLAKIGVSNPLIVFGTIIDQIEIYDNMIQPVVESFKYLSPLACKYSRWAPP